MDLNFLARPTESGRSVSHHSSYSLSVVSVATNQYRKYWKELASSIETFVHGFESIRMYVLTDAAHELDDFGQSLERVGVQTFPIPNLTWPDATLLRYRLIAEIAPEMRGSIYAHMDADMVLVGDVSPNTLQPSCWDAGMALVAHPGYARGQFNSHVPRRRSLIAKATRSVRYLQMGGSGAWETRRASTAYVPRADRKEYVCGGIWFGFEKPFVSMCRTLARRVEIDRDNGVLARWHDESHLNWYHAEVSTSVLGPEFCTPEGWTLSGNKTPLVIAVDKGRERTR